MNSTDLQRIAPGLRVGLLYSLLAHCFRSTCGTASVRTNYYPAFAAYGINSGPSLSSMPENRPELPFLTQACLKYCFRAYVAYLSPGTRQARAGTPEGPLSESVRS